MTNYEIELAKKRYNEIQLEKKEYEQLKQRINELKQKPIVQEYLSLIDKTKEIEGNKTYDEVAIINESFDNLAGNTKESNNIKIYMGAYRMNVFIGAELIRTKDADYVLYYDLENYRTHEVNIYQCFTFEEENIVIHIDDKNFGCFQDYMKAFNKLRNEFLGELLIKPQEEVVKQFVKKYQNK